MQTPVSLFSSATTAAAATAPNAEAAPQSSQADAPVDHMAAPQPAGSIAALSQEAADCRLCSLCETRRQVVFGSGNPHADLLLIGEAPGQEEDRQGEPFVGRAGQLLDGMLRALQLQRDDVYIMNTIKCRPPNNRDPQPDELEACHHWLAQQLALLQPKVICLLGRVAARTLLQQDARLADLRGCWHDYHGIPTLVTYHPAYLLRTPRDKSRSWQDLQMLVGRLNSASAAAQHTA